MEVFWQYLTQERRRQTHPICTLQLMIQLFAIRHNDLFYQRACLFFLSRRDWLPVRRARIITWMEKVWICITALWLFTTVVSAKAHCAFWNAMNPAIPNTTLCCSLIYTIDLNIPRRLLGQLCSTFRWLSSPLDWLVSAGPSCRCSRSILQCNASEFCQSLFLLLLCSVTPNLLLSSHALHSF